MKNSEALSLHAIGRAAIAAVALAALGACALAPTGTPREIVAKRVDQRWSALKAGKFDYAYELTAPSYRKENDFTKFRANFGAGMEWKEIELVSTVCEADKCNVRLRVSATPPRGLAHIGTIATAVDEIWVLEDGNWWFQVK